MIIIPDEQAEFERQYDEPMDIGWTPDKIAIVKEQFYDFLNYVTVNSKEKGPIILGQHVYRAQRRFIDAVFEGLSRGIHDFKVLKSRQLGISTFARALTLFWIGVHGGMKGYMVFDTGEHREEARKELETMINLLPPQLGFPTKGANNRTMLGLSNNSGMTFASAGVRESKSSGTLGRSSGINFVHASEMCSWSNIEGLESFKAALAEEFPDRLYLWESTARGFNQWHDMWMEAKEDTAHQATIFLGWWSKDNQEIRRSHPDFERYGTQPPSEMELEKIKAVKDQYDWDITPEQLAWYRRKMDPTAKADGDAPAEYEGDGLKMQEQPWTEQEAFQQTGASFFEPEDLTKIINEHVSKKYKTYSYATGIEFVDTRINPAHNAKMVQLKVWEEPDPDGVYVVAADPAFGVNENNDRSAIQVLRCYADGVDQVAEYAWPLVNTRQFAWVIASLLGYYSECYLILELNGPGMPVWQELQSLKHQLSVGYQPQEVEDRGLRNVFRNVKNYLYGRADAMAPGRNYMWKTSGPLKVGIMERLRDFVSNSMLIVRSMDTVTEMTAVTREGDSIEAQGAKKDDRVMALALGVRCWEERVRKSMSTQKRTRSNEAAKKRITVYDQIAMYNTSQLTSMFAVKQRSRNAALAQARRDSWRGRR